MENSNVALEIAKSYNSLLSDLRDYRDSIMNLPDTEEGRPHSHGETDNSRGLRLRAISLAITELENSAKRAEDALLLKLGEYQFPLIINAEGT
jgi:hypothetical protein